MSLVGNWIQNDPINCPTECGQSAGGGTAGAVTCSKGDNGCDNSTKPDPKECVGTPTCGNWIVGEPVGCSHICDMEAGGSGLPGIVTCSTASGCDGSNKPAPKLCPATAECAFPICKFYPSYPPISPLKFS